MPNNQLSQQPEQTDLHGGDGVNHLGGDLDYAQDSQQEQQAHHPHLMQAQYANNNNNNGNDVDFESQGDQFANNANNQAS